MSKTHPTGWFIVFEGIDSHALQDQVEKLYSSLREDKVKVHLTREPSDGPFGSQIRLILDGRLDVDDGTLALFFATDRMDHLNKSGGILERLESSEHVICLRYYLSSFAYQVPHSDLEWLRWINDRCRRPDLTLFLDTPITACLESLVQSGLYAADELERERDKLEKVRKNYLIAIEILRDNGERIEIIGGNRAATSTAKDIAMYVYSLME